MSSRCIITQQRQLVLSCHVISLHYNTAETIGLILSWIFTFCTPDVRSCISVMLNSLPSRFSTDSKAMLIFNRSLFEILKGPFWLVTLVALAFILLFVILLWWEVLSNKLQLLIFEMLLQHYNLIPVCSDKEENNKKKMHYTNSFKAVIANTPLWDMRVIVLSFWWWIMNGI